MNQTHQSICSFAKWNCEQQLKKKEERVLVHIDECQFISPNFNLTVNYYLNKILY